MSKVLRMLGLEIQDLSFRFPFPVFLDRDYTNGVMNMKRMVSKILTI